MFDLSFKALQYFEHAFLLNTFSIKHFLYQPSCDLYVHPFIMRNLLIFISLLLVGIQAHVIEIENGKISGIEYENYYAYKGIKYATAKRFSLPKPTDQKWCGIKEFKSYKSKCAQYSHLTYDFNGVEDCLFLNVFVPKKVSKSKESAPVVFYIHGGMLHNYFYTKLQRHHTLHQKVISICFIISHQFIRENRMDSQIFIRVFIPLFC